MVGFADFQRELGHALNHLHDPDYRPAGGLYAVLDSDPAEGPGPLQALIHRAIENLRPAPDLPLGSRPRQHYDVLHHRFVLGLTQEESADLLHASGRTIQRMQRGAIHSLALALWQGRHTTEEMPGDDTGQAPSSADAEAPGWRSQADRELASLERSAPHTTTDVGETLRDVMGLVKVLAPSQDLRLQLAHVQPDLVGMIHPSALRQMLIAAIRRLAQHTPDGQITIYVGREDASVKITLLGKLAAQPVLSESDLTDGIITPAGSSVRASVEADNCFLYITVPSEGEITVLAVDDNPDMFHFYRRCTAGTCYRLIHAATGRQGRELIRALPPDIIVLDVMLPDVDGWQLLIELHEDLSTRPIPVVVCSVVREEDLAYSLGAAFYLPKPIQPRQFTEALDRAYSQVSEKARRGQANNGAAW